MYGRLNGLHKERSELEKIVKSVRTGRVAYLRDLFPDGTVDLLPEGPPIGLAARIIEAAKKVQ